MAPRKPPRDINSNERDRFEIPNEIFELLADHVFLPKRISVKDPENLPYQEEILLEFMLEVINGPSVQLPASTHQLFERMVDVHCHGGMDKIRIAHHIDSLSPGQMFGLYIRQQNCGLLIYAPPNGDRIVSTFQASVPNEIISSSNSDVQVDYPTQSILVPDSEILSSTDFAEQLVVLFQSILSKAMPTSRKAGQQVTEIRDVANDIFVSEWLLATLSDHQSKMASTSEFPQISKKVRDEVILMAGDDPFRRSGMWMTIKVFLQLNLCLEFGEAEGLVRYKALILQAMCEMCQVWLRTDFPEVNIDLAMQMLAKIARRNEKLIEFAEDFNFIVNPIRNTVIATIEAVRSKIDIQFEDLLTSDQLAYKPLSNLDFEKHVVHTIPKLASYIQKREDFQKPKPEKNRFSKPEGIARHRAKNAEIPDIHMLNETTEEKMNFVLVDFENWIANHLENECFSDDVTEIRAFALAYSKKAKSFYAGDPLGGSRMILSLLKIVQVLDEIATDEHELLLEHRSGIDPKIIDELLLPQRKDLEMALSLQEYFTDRNAAAIYPSLIEEEAPTENSFAVRYAETDPDMIQTRQNILRREADMIAKKKLALGVLRLKVTVERMQLSTMECDDYTFKDRYGRTRSKHNNFCRRCALRKKISEYRVDLFERPLRNEAHNQNAVVFELMIPDELACLRDVLHNFVYEFCNASSTTNKIVGKWSDYDQISKYSTHNQESVFLGSTTVLFVKSHYGRPKHPDDPDEAFIVNNGYNCNYFSGEQYILSNTSSQTVKKYTTFNVEPDTLYSKLQWTVVGTKHTQNGVLASQNKCPPSLPLREYIAFGSLRSDGHRLQIRNLFRAIETESLSFESNSVIFLVMQALWEAGPNEGLTWQRESHEDLCDPIFTGEMVALLKRYLDIQRHNWKQPMKLLLVIIIAVRILELNEDPTIIKSTADILVECRKIACDWIASIQKAKSNCDCTNMANIIALRNNLKDAAICCGLTFMLDCESEYFSQIQSKLLSNTTKSISKWAQAIVNIQENILLTRVSFGEMTSMRRNALRLIRNIGVNIEEQLHALIVSSPKNLIQFSKIQWAGAQTCRFDPWNRVKGVEQVVFSTLVEPNGDIHYVSIDLIGGVFLVDGAPVSRLPHEITANPNFERLFGATIFEAQPTKSGTYCTKYSINGHNYFFQFEDTELIVQEKSSRGKVYELIPHSKMANEIPFLLVDRYSHWWNREQNIMEFRPKDFSPKDFFDRDKVQFKLDFNTGILTDLRTEKKFIDIQSTTYDNIVRFLKRLEDKKYIHVILEDSHKATVELPRMRLHFKIDLVASPDIISHEFEGMVISKNQKIGAFIGLEYGLLLEDKNTQQKMMIVPHGAIATHGFLEGHLNVHIKLDKLRNPTFFVYTVDERCRILKARNNFAAWFFLAHLHGITSHPLPDPFTGMTGTERALQILQSGFVWSSSPYDVEAQKTLSDIADLAPKRIFYPTHLKNMQRIQWPKLLSSSAAHDAYQIVVDKLIEDSIRLGFLHPKSISSSAGKTEKTEETEETEETEKKEKTPRFFNLKAYRRHISLYPNSKLTDDFPIDASFSTIHHHIIEKCNHDVLNNMRKIASLSKDTAFCLPSNIQNILLTFFITKECLKGQTSRSYDDILSSCSQPSIRNIWIDLYNIIRKEDLSEAKIQLMLTFLLFSGVDLSHIYILQTIAMNFEEFASIDPPDFLDYVCPNDLTFTDDTITEVFKLHPIHFDTYIEWNERRLRDLDEDEKNEIIAELEEEFELKVAEQSEQLMEVVRQKWPCSGVESVESLKFSPVQKVVNVEAALPSINVHLYQWNKNRLLRLFLIKMSKMLCDLSENAEQQFEMPSWDYPDYHQTNEKEFLKYDIDFTSKMCEQFDQPKHIFRTKYSDTIFKMGKVDTNGATYADCFSHLWQELESLSIPRKDRYLTLVGLYPRIVPAVILPMLLSSENEPQTSIIGAIAVTISLDQRRQRIAKLGRMLPQMEVQHTREVDTVPFENWSPSEYPQWLLFQIENDLTIRRIQVEVAKQMLNPSSGRHSVMQLNMGEGKTAVIVPLLASVLADGDKLCQITVLRSLFQTNLRSLRQCLGGMLNHRVYTFPCRRDMKIEENGAQMIQSCYEECMRMKGVVMTLPENRLSFHLKMYESARKDDLVLAESLEWTHEWLSENVRSILDESDAILEPKYQLIYTVGEQLPPCGGSLRWTIIQDLLKRVPQHMYDLWKEHGSEMVEFNDKFKEQNRPEIFWPCRILDQSIYPELISKIAEDFIKGMTDVKFTDLRETQWADLRATILNPYVDETVARRCFDMFSNKTSLQETIFILSGLLKYDVFRMAFTKRWRVNYGVSETGRRKMAIPFKAKDVAAEMTEFGHPDVAIALTHLSYYYSGLSDVQLRECFDSLKILQDPEEQFNIWIKAIKIDVDPSIRSYTGINLSDPKQRDEHLFPALRFNMYVIDFWLSYCVFPREAKLFSGKIMCTAWDLCSEDMTLPVTGFSGTNDTKLLLPLPVGQNDLPELEGTNEQVRQYLLLAENNNYKKLPSCVSGIAILKSLVSDQIPVLLDSGALMLELNNQQVAEEWLKLAPSKKYQAAVYFNSADVLMVRDRKGFETEFELSPFRERLQCCLVYLDDVHTRGTDLRFPRGTRACVTLCGGITRDKTVQACMRMRLLGQGHTVSFWASEEADNGIREVGEKGRDDAISTEHVVKWICYNSEKFEKDGLVHWAAAGLNYTQKTSAHRDSTDLSLLSTRCSDKETLDLRDMYGFKTESLLIDILHKQFGQLLEIYSNPASNQIYVWINAIKNGIIDRLSEHNPKVKRFTQLLDEEQEKELEYELEEQREVSRPGRAEAPKPSLDQLVEEFIRKGVSEELDKTKSFYELSFALRRTSLWPLAQQNCWGTDIFVTKDFLVAIKNSSNDKEDEFMRPVWWVVSAGSADDNSAEKLLLLSPFEANAYIALFRSNQASTTLHMYSPRLKAEQSIFMDNKNLQLPAVSGPNISDQHRSELAVFSGSLYFEDKREQDAYCAFLGLIPRPRSVEHNRAFENNLIDFIGFVPPKNRHISKEIQMCCNFVACPDSLVKGIVERRTGYLPRACDVSLIVTESKKRFTE